MSFWTITVLTSVLALMLVCNCDIQPKIKGPGRVEAEPGEFPYFVWIKNKEGKLVTGGILIRPQVVLTLGYNYMTTKPKELTVVLGTHDKTAKEPSRQEIKVTDIVIHPELIRTIKRGAMGDVALMRLKSEPMDDGSKRIKTFGVNNIVSMASDDKQAWKKGASCVSPGYGAIQLGDDGGPIYPTNLQKFSPYVIPPDACNTIFELKRKPWMCSLNEDRTASCYGDGAGPLLCKNEEGKYLLYGIGSGGSKKCNQGFSFWTRMSTYFTWIKAEANKLQNL